MSFRLLCCIDDMIQKHAHTHTYTHARAINASKFSFTREAARYAHTKRKVTLRARWRGDASRAWHSHTAVRRRALSSSRIPIRHYSWHLPELGSKALLGEASLPALRTKQELPETGSINLRA